MSKFWSNYYIGQAWMGRGYGDGPRRALLPTTGTAMKLCACCGGWTPVRDTNAGQCPACKETP